LIEVLGGDAAAVKELEQSEHKLHKHMFPMFCCFKPWTNEGGVWFYRCKYGDLQYVPIKLILAVITFATHIKGKFHDGKLAWNDAWPYVCFIQNISQLWALYCLVFFVHGAPKELKKISPVRKLLVIKGVVFFTFWQAVLISLLVNLGLIRRTEKWKVETISSGLQNFMVCIEMFVAAIFHIWAFPAVEPDVVIPDEHNDQHRKRKAGRMVSAVNLLDVGKDVKKMITHKSPKKGAPAVEEDPSTDKDKAISVEPSTNDATDDNKDKDKDKGVKKASDEH